MCLEQKDQVDLLTRLGLSLNQARVYLALAKFSPSTANQVSKTADLPTEIVYRTMPKLQQKGLVEKVVSTPAKFQATPMKLTIELLLERKKQENNQTLIKAREFLETVTPTEAKTNRSEEPRTVLIPERERLIQFLKEKLLTVQESICMVITGQKFSGWILAYNKHLKEILKKKISIRLVVAGNIEEQQTPSLHELLQDQNFALKSATDPIQACVIVYDGREAVIATEVNTPFARSPAYWSNNLSVVALCQTYFETCWKRKSLEKKHTKQMGKPPRSAKPLLIH
jgi:sugar-specific transcriptional regulator TrmB